MNRNDFQEVTLQGRKCLIRQKGDGGPAIYWGTFFHQDNEVEHLSEELETALPQQDYLLVAFLADDWNRDFSPWEAPAAFGDQPFGGKGPEMLQWLLQEAVPYVESTFGKREERILMGYSLAGLFALWAAYKCDLFTGIVCASGSLWFPDWDVFVRENQIPTPCRIYLSLGGKEEKTRNQMMATIGDRMRSQEQILKKDPNVQDVILEWNSGGHFADSGKRLVKGISWLCK